MGIITIVILISCILIFDNQNNKILNEKQTILEIFKGVDILSLINSSTTDVNLYYKGYVYSFNEKGYEKKEEIAEGNEYYEKSIYSVIKVSGNTKPLVTEYIIDERE